MSTTTLTRPDLKAVEPTLTILNPDVDIFPERILIDGIKVDAFKNRTSLLERLVQEAKKPGKCRFYNLNVHIANMAHKHPKLKNIFKTADVVYCDGSGIALASRIIGDGIIPKRFANADWLFEMLDFFAQNQCTVYYLGNAPGILDKALSPYTLRNPKHSIVGWHHGHILNDEQLEARVIDEINRVRPDILFVGFGCPLQEFWIEKHFEKLNVGLFYPNGAAMDYQAGKIPRCPVWLGDLGLEWLFRLAIEPKRLAHRYLIGNPWFFYRILIQSFQKRISDPFKHASPTLTEAS